MWKAIPLSLVISENRQESGFLHFFLGTKICNFQLICQYLYIVEVQMAHLDK